LFLYTYWFVSISTLIQTFLIKRKRSESILYLTAFYPGNAGYHWRAEKWAEELRAEGKKVTLMHALDEEEFRNLLKHDFNQFLLLYLKRRFWQVLESRKYETVIVQRELLVYNDYGNLFLEKLMLRLHPDAILDFDDDLSAAKNQPRKITNRYGKLIQEHGDKFNASLKLYKHFIVASDYLKNRVLEQNTKIDEQNVCVIPTCVDYDNFPAKDYSTRQGPIVLGWIGGDHNYHLLDLVIPSLNRLSATYPFKFKLIGGSTPDFKTDFKLEFIPWSLKREIDELLTIDVGLMPLPDDAESRGKGAFKLIQYMGLGIVSIASPITINKQIVKHGTNSLLAMTEREWDEAFENILSGQLNLSELGKNARSTIERNYTFKGNKEKYFEFIEHVRNSRHLDNS
jgi:glycosyltransferase involved in cell wall biosynthesis